MDTIERTTDGEFAAMQTVFCALEPLDEDSRQRVVDYIVARLGISAARSTPSVGLSGGEREGGTSEQEGETPSAREFATLAELHDASDPQSDRDRVLVTAYWLQVCEGADSFLSYSVNKALKDLGHGVSNVTGAFEALKNRKPALVLQLKKAGKSRQARKTYKVTNAGIAAVKAMIDGG